MIKSPEENEETNHILFSYTLSLPLSSPEMMHRSLVMQFEGLRRHLNISVVTFLKSMKPILIETFSPHSIYDTSIILYTYYTPST